MKQFVLSAVLGLALTGLSGAALAEQAPDEAQLEQGKVLFMSGAVPACAICHTLKDAGSSGTIGPDLNELKPTMDRVRKAVTEGLGAMPAFAATLSEEEINAVAAYVAHATQGG